MLTAAFFRHYRKLCTDDDVQKSLLVPVRQLNNEEARMRSDFECYQELLDILSRIKASAEFGDGSLFVGNVKSYQTIMTLMEYGFCVDIHETPERKIMGYKIRWDVQAVRVVNDED